MLTRGPTFIENAFSVLKFLKVIFSFILHSLILRKSMCYGSRRGTLPNNTSCHLIAKLRKVIIILGGPTGRSPGSPTGQSAKFHNWSQAKRLNALPLSLGGPTKAWYDTMPPETVGDFRTLTQGLKERFGSQLLEFLFRQELFARKQGPSEPLSFYTEDVIRKCQRLGLSDKDLMNAFINGLCEDTKNHVILSQPKSFAEAENLARLREAVSKTSSSPFSEAKKDVRRKCQIDVVF